MTDQGRIRLAEAMGWTECRRGPRPDMQSSEITKDIDYCWGYKDGKYLQELPDPSKDANDDYAVLEWMRSHKDTYPFFASFEGEIGRLKWDYGIGDYAKAALKVIE